MRAACVGFSILLGLGMISCGRDDRAAREHSAAREAGRQAYRASQEVKHGAKEAAHDLRSASKDFREGWSEAKHDEPTHRRK